MGEGKTNMFGKTYNTIGSTDSNFLIKTKGDLKVQWGGKFIDIIKNGKLASAGADILKVATSSDEISSNGIYLVPTEEGNEVWISIDGTKINLAGEVGTTYVSFLAEQKEVTADQKYTALTNAGFYYETLEQAKASGIKAGIVFIPSEQKLYVIKDGQFSDYYLVQSSINNTTSEKDNTFDEILIGDLRIYNDSGYSRFNTSTKLMFSINNEQYMTIEDEIIQIHKTIQVEDNVIIQSKGSNQNRGFRLYNTSNGSVLEVDSVIWRNQDSEQTKQTQRLDSSVIYSKHNNIILSSSVVGQEDQQSKIACSLKYTNYFQPNQSVYVFLSQEVFQYVLSVYSYVEEQGYSIEAILKNDQIAPELISVRIQYNDDQEVIITIPKGERSAEVNLGNLESLNIDSKTIIQGPNNITIEGQDPDSIFFDKATAYECTVYSVNNQEVILNIPIQISESFINSSPDTVICLSNTQLLKVQENNIDVLDRSKTITEEVTNESGIVETIEKPDETIHTRIGTVKETDFQQLKECPEEQEEVNVGIYSDNFIGLNSKLYDPIFKKRCDFPKYDESIEVPEDFDDKKYDRAVPNIEWIKELIDRAVPKGTITMFNGASDIPIGWAVCDGTNGTPNLIGKFVKAVATVDQIGDNPSELNENNELILAQEHLPKHSHPHKEHTHSLDGNISGTTGSSGDLTVVLDYSDYNWGIEGVTKTFVTSVAGEGVTTESGTVDGVSNIKTQGGNATGGSHTHSISLDTDGGVSLSSTKSQEEELVDSEWPNNPIKIEPRSYSLIFIMKL